MGKRIAQFIVAERSVKPIDTTFELVEVIKRPFPREQGVMGRIRQREHSRP